MIFFLKKIILNLHVLKKFLNKLLHCTGYAIIQLPELITFLHKRVVNITCNTPLKREVANHLQTKPATIKIGAGQNENVETNMQSVVGRLLKLEQENIEIFKKLDGK